MGQVAMRHHLTHPRPQVWWASSSHLSHLRRSHRVHERRLLLHAHDGGWRHRLHHWLHHWLHWRLHWRPHLWAHARVGPKRWAGAAEATPGGSGPKRHADVVNKYQKGLTSINPPPRHASTSLSAHTK